MLGTNETDIEAGGRGNVANHDVKYVLSTVKHSSACEEVGRVEVEGWRVRGGRGRGSLGRGGSFCCCLRCSTESSSVIL